MAMLANSNKTKTTKQEKSTKFATCMQKYSQNQNMQVMTSHK